MGDRQPAASFRKMVLKFERKIFMQFLQAKVKDNKLGVEDTYPIAIDTIEFFKGSIVIYVTKRNGSKTWVSYSSLEKLFNEFDVVDYGDFKEIWYL